MKHIACVKQPSFPSFWKEDCKVWARQSKAHSWLSCVLIYSRCHRASTFTALAWAFSWSALHDWNGASLSKTSQERSQLADWFEIKTDQLLAGSIWAREWGELLQQPIWGSEASVGWKVIAPRSVCMPLGYANARSPVGKGVFWKLVGTSTPVLLSMSAHRQETSEKPANFEE